MISIFFSTIVKKKEIYFFPFYQIEHRLMNSFLKSLLSIRTEYKVLIGVLVLLLLFALFFPRSNIYNTYNYTPEKFENAFEETNEPTVVLFKVNWCGYCKQFLPEWARFSQSSPIRTLVIDCEQYPDIAKRYNIQGFPQVKYFPRGTSSEQFMDYNGERSSKALQEFVNSMTMKSEQFENQQEMVTIDVPTNQPHSKKEEDEDVSSNETFANASHQEKQRTTTGVVGAPARMPDQAMAYPFQ
jgi:thiol-disulfide isomerase/thioredoxin